MASISKRGDTYRIKVSCGYNTDGKQVVKSMTWKPGENMTPKQIEKELTRVSTQYESMVTKGECAESGNMKLEEFCKQYLQIIELSPTTMKLYKSVIESIIVPALGHMKLKDIRPIHSQQLIQQLSKPSARVDKKGDKLAAATIRRYFTVYQSILTKAYKLDLIDSDPASARKLVFPQQEEPEVQIFTKEEAEYMLTCLADEPPMYQVLINTAIVTGCRRGEIAALKWNCIDFDKGYISVRASNYKLTGENISTKKPKTRKSERDIAIPPYLIDMLKRYHTEQIKQQISLGDQWKGAGWIFTQCDGQPMNPQTPTKWFSNFLKRHNIPHRKFHALRHTSATLLLAEGTNIKNVASRLGHTQLSTTNRYVHALRDADKSAAMVFENMNTKDEKIDEKKA